MTRVTPLLGFLRALEPDQRKAFADEVGTTVVYLYQLAGQPWPNPKLKLAMALIEASAKWAGRAHGKVKPLSYDDLLVGTSDEPPGAGSE